MKDKRSLFRQQHLFIWLLVGLILAVVLLVYYPSLNNGFVNWDDEKYVLDNQLIRELNAENLIGYFTEPVSSNFHPLTVFSLALDYHFFGEEPTAYHLHNLILHLINTLLVFLLILSLSNKKIWVATFVALIFGIHPMHVESVAWISERKDVLYSFYFLLGLIIYLRYKKQNKTGLLVITFILFVFSTLAKSAAVIFPLVLILIDIYQDKGLKRKALLMKIPFLALSVLIGVIALETQSGAITSIERIPLGDRITYASYGFFIYIIKFFVPYHLSTLHLFPRPVPELYYLINPIAIITGIYFLYRLIKKPDSSPVFGFWFYLITIVLVLQIITIGTAVIAERYTYLPYIGIAYMVAMFVDKKWTSLKNRKLLQYALIILVSFFIVTQAVLANKRISVWEHGGSLWKDVLKKYPKNHIAANNLGNYFLKNYEFDSAYSYYSKAAKLNSNYKEPHYNMGLCYYAKEDYEKALNSFNAALIIDKDYSRAIRYKQKTLIQLKEIDPAIEYFTTELDPENARPEDYFDRGILFFKDQKFRDALISFNQAIKMDNDFVKSIRYRQKCLVKLGNMEEAMNDLDYLVINDPNHPGNFFDRGALFYREGNYNKALADFMKVIELDKDYNPSVYNNIGLCLFNLNKNAEAIGYFDEAEKRGVANRNTYYGRAMVLLRTGNKVNAVSDFTKVIQLDPDFKAAYKQRAFIYIAEKEYKKATADLTDYLRLVPDDAEILYNRSVAWYYQAKWEPAFNDAKRAKQLGYNVPEKYLNNLRTSVDNMKK